MKLIEAFYQYLESEFCSWQANPYYREKCINVGMKNSFIICTRNIIRKLLIKHDLAFPTDYRSEDLAFTLMVLSHCDPLYRLALIFHID